MEMGGQLRMARAQLYKDMAGATCDGIPKSTPGDDDKADGYIEIVEGQWSDKAPSALMDGDAGNGELDYATSLVPSGGDPQIVIDSDLTNPVRTPVPNDVTNGGGLGDYDDILALTVRSDSEPFVGRRLVLRQGGVSTNPNDWIYEAIESNLAEVIWYAVENPADGSIGEPGMRTVYRRVLLIAPWLSPIDLAAIPTTGGGAINPGNANRFYQRFDISARYDITTAKWVPNTLSDLTKRENRFAHFFDNTAPNKGFPHPLMQGAISPPNATPPAYPTGSPSPFHPFGVPWFTPISSFDDPDRQGEDVMLNDVLAFDAPLRQHPPLPAPPTSVLEPSDFGWDAASITAIGYGAYVDLGWNPGYTWAGAEPDPLFHLGHEVGWHPNNPTALTGFPRVYDTWSFHYENDGIDQGGVSAAPDEFINKLDDDNANGTDDVGERETSPPYNVPLRGIQVKLRVYDPDTRQIREATVTRGF